AGERDQAIEQQKKEHPAGDAQPAGDGAAQAIEIPDEPAADAVQNHEKADDQLAFRASHEASRIKAAASVWHDDRLYQPSPSRLFVAAAAHTNPILLGRDDSAFFERRAKTVEYFSADCCLLACRQIHQS